MTVFSGDPSEWERLDWQLFQNGAVAMYFRPNVLSEDLSWLRDHGYRTFEFNCDRWTSETIVHNDFKQTLNFPDSYGRHLDALHDSLSDITVPPDGGVALVLYHYDSYVATAGALPAAPGRPYSEVILDILAGTSRFFLLTGLRFLVMIQSNDPRMRFDRLGCVTATWNPREWLDKSLGL